MTAKQTEMFDEEVQEDKTFRILDKIDYERDLVPKKGPRGMSRHDDPGSSHEAADEIKSSGLADTQRQLCLDEVNRCQGQTAAEIAVAIGLERHIPSRRLPELRDKTSPLQVRNGDGRICKVTGNRSMTWYVC